MDTTRTFTGRREVLAGAGGAALSLSAASGATRLAHGGFPRARIERDRFGVPHIHGKTDADAAFGLGYAQAEDNFAHLQDNFIRALGRGAEVHGEAAFADDRL